MKQLTTRREWLKTMGVGLTSAITAPIAFPQTKKRNVLFIAVDDLRPQLDCYGVNHVISPNIDRLAKDGLLFKRSFCNIPVCGASRASLLTGIRPQRDRFVGYDTWAEKDAPGYTTLPGLFKKHGYHTISNGKVFHHRTDSKESWSEEPWRPKGEWGGRGYLLDENYEIAKESDRGLGPAYEAADVEDNEYADGKTADKSISDLRRMKEQEKPFFLAVGFVKPHLPFNAPKKYWDMYDREKIPMADNDFVPENAPDAAIHNWGELRQYTDIPQQGRLSDEKARTLVHGYHACVSYIDAQVGRLLDELETLGLRDNTVVILWGDHGWNLREHTLWCKHCNFQTSLRAPMIIRAPGYEGGIKTDALTEFVDIYPTLCDLCELPKPDHLQGDSFVPLMKNPDQSWKKAIFSRFNNGDSIRTDRYLYTEWRNQQGELYAKMLYDHKTDPQENVNIAEKPDNEELVKQLSQQLKKGKALAELE